MCKLTSVCVNDVAPLAGAWIEINQSKMRLMMLLVAPLAGAWIEIPTHATNTQYIVVAPLAGAWIEILRL